MIGTVVFKKDAYIGNKCVIKKGVEYEIREHKPFVKNGEREELVGFYCEDGEMTYVSFSKNTGKEYTIRLSEPEAVAEEE